MNALLSIIVPVYNIEQYLSRCVDSILGQSFTDFELLLIDDGSNDGSGAICEEYVAKDSRVHVFHKENGGVSSARNLGLKHAKSDWICFVDADDELRPEGLQVMVDGVSDKVGMVMAGFQELENGQVLTDSSCLEINGVMMDRNEALLLMYPSVDKIYMGYPWAKLFNREFIASSGLLFNEDIAIKEDTLFVVNYLCRSEKPVCFTPVPVYNYQKNSSGAMGSLAISYNEKYLTSFDAVVEMNRLIQKLPGLDKKLSNAAKYEVVNRCYLIYGYMLRTNAVDRTMVSDLKKRAVKEVGFGYYLCYQYQRNTRRIRKIFQNKP